MKTSTSGGRGSPASQATLASASGDRFFRRARVTRLSVEPTAASDSMVTKSSPTMKSSDHVTAGSVEVHRHRMYLHKKPTITTTAAVLASSLRELSHGSTA